MILHLECCPTPSDPMPSDDLKCLFGALLPNHVLPGHLASLK
jgi:hypothetical protein